MDVQLYLSRCDTDIQIQPFHPASWHNIVIARASREKFAMPLIIHNLLLILLKYTGILAHVQTVDTRPSFPSPSPF